MTVDFSSNLKVHSALSVSYAAVGYGFVFMSFPVGLPLKIAGVALEVIGCYAACSIHQALDHKNQLIMKEDGEYTYKQFKENLKLSYKDVLLCSGIIALISACFIMTLE